MRLSALLVFLACRHAPVQPPVLVGPLFPEELTEEGCLVKDQVLYCRQGSRLSSFDQTAIERPPEEPLPCPPATWVSSRTASPPLMSRAEGSWCVDEQLRRRGPAYYRGTDGEEAGHTVLGQFVDDKPCGTWVRRGPDGAVQSTREYAACAVP